MSLSGITCPDGWSQFLGNCYKFVNETKVWSEAQDECLSQQVLTLRDYPPSFFFVLFQADLASIHSSEENEFVYKLGGGTRFWLGGKLDGLWTWADGTSWNYKNWEPGQPSGGEGCLELGWSAPRKWNDRACDNTNVNIGYVCKIY